MYIWHWQGNMNKRGHLEDLGIGRSIILKWLLKKYYGKVQTGLILLRIANEILASQEGFSIIELVRQLIFDSQ